MRKINANKMAPSVLEGGTRNKAFDVLKLFFTVIVIVHHSGYISGLLNRGYISVEFFFITSGMFLYRTAENHPELSTAGYFIKRAKRLYPEYWFSMIVLLLSQIIMGEIAYNHWYSPILEATLTRCIGIPLTTEALNGPCWYLSVLMFGGLLLYFLLKKLSRKACNMIAVVAAAVIYGFFASRSVSIEQWDTVGKVFYLPFWRGIADMIVGIIICQLPKPKRIVGNILEIVSGIGILALLRVNGSSDYLALGFMVLLIWAISAEKPILSQLANNKVVNWFSRYQYGLYVNHICVIAVFKQITFIQNINHWVRLLMLLVCIFILAMMGNYMTRRVKARSDPSDDR